MKEFACVDEENRKEWEFLLYDYVEKLCDKDVRKRVEKHIKECEYCKKELLIIEYIVSGLKIL